jgi:ABC-type phosphate transport system substrate-binding protein
MSAISTMKHIGLTFIFLVLSLPTADATAEMVAVVSAENPVTALSRHQIVDIFLGRARQFPDGRQALPVDQLEGSAARDTFYLDYSGQSPAQIKAYWSKIIFTGRGQPPPVVPNGQQVKKFIAEHPSAIGYIDDQLVDGSVRVVQVK